MIGFTLSQATLWFIKELDECLVLKPRLLEIAYSNMFGSEQMAEFDVLIQGLFSLAGAVLTLRFCEKGEPIGKTA
jgi:hypothetical protein